MSDDLNAQALVHAKLTGETATIHWAALQRFFAQGRAIEVQPGLDLIEVGMAINADDADRVEAWIAAGQLAPVPDGRAKQWIDADALVWALVVRPWVLVQGLDRGAESG